MLDLDQALPVTKASGGVRRPVSARVAYGRHHACVPRVASAVVVSVQWGAHGATYAPGALFLVCRRRVARVAAHRGFIPAKVAGCRNGTWPAAAAACDPHSFRAEMAGAHRLRYQPFRPCNLRNSASREPGPGTRPRQRGERSCGICEPATIGFRQAAIGRPKEGRLEATAATQSEAARTPARAHGGAATAIRLVRSQVLVSRTAFTLIAVR